MCPLIHANYLIIGAAVAGSFVFGSLWYGPLFGATWATLTGIKTEDLNKPEPAAIVLTFLGTILTTLVLSYFIQIDKPYCVYGTAFFIWLGFYVPLLLSSVNWEGRPWKLFGLNALYYFLNLQLIAVILSI